MFLVRFGISRNGIEGHDDWEQRLELSVKKAKVALAEKDTERGAKRTL